MSASSESALSAMLCLRACRSLEISARMNANTRSSRVHFRAKGRGSSCRRRGGEIKRTPVIKSCRANVADAIKLPEKNHQRIGRTRRTNERRNENTRSRPASLSRSCERLRLRELKEKGEKWGTEWTEKTEKMMSGCSGSCLGTTRRY
jgi:hypothetical protein